MFPLKPPSSLSFASSKEDCLPAVAVSFCHSPWPTLLAFMLITKAIGGAGLHYAAFCTKLTNLRTTLPILIRLFSLNKAASQHLTVPLCSLWIWWCWEGSLIVSFQHPHAECCPLSETVRVSVTRKQQITTPGLTRGAWCQPPGHWKELQSSDNVLISKFRIAFARLVIGHESRRTECRRPSSSHWNTLMPVAWQTKVGPAER